MRAAVRIASPRDEEACEYVRGAWIGGGGFGDVYQARHARSDTPVALKVLKAEYRRCPTVRMQFEQEGRLPGLVAHPGVIDVLQTGTMSDGSPYIAMEHLEGMDMERLLHVAAPGPWALEMMLALCDTLAAVHERGVVHCDIKPSNVFLTVDRRVKLLDFGIARFIGQSIHASVVEGTPSYASPEQLEGSIVDARSDLYSLGAVASRILGVVGNVARRVLESAMSPDRALRQASVREFAAGLKDALLSNS